MKFLIVYIAVLMLNGYAFTTYVRDKRLAEQGLRRIPERDLHFIAMIGGSVGALSACYVARHKTRKMSFLIPLWLIAIAQFGFFFYVMVAGPPEFLTDLIKLIPDKYISKLTF